MFESEGSSPRREDVCRGAQSSWTTPVGSSSSSDVTDALDGSFSPNDCQVALVLMNCNTRRSLESLFLINGVR